MHEEIKKKKNEKKKKKVQIRFLKVHENGRSAEH